MCGLYFSARPSLFTLPTWPLHHEVTLPSPLWLGKRESLLEQSGLSFSEMTLLWCLDRRYSFQLGNPRLNVEKALQTLIWGGKSLKGMVVNMYKLLSLVTVSVVWCGCIYLASILLVMVIGSLCKPWTPWTLGQYQPCDQPVFKSAHFQYWIMYVKMLCLLVQTNTIF